MGRDVRLHAGEAAFDVVHDARHPFTVQAGADQVRVLGTEFDVDRKPDTLRVTVRRGLVEVAGQGAPVRVAAGQQLERGGVATSVKAAKADDAFAWKQGRLVYDARPLWEVAADLTRRFPTPVRTDASAASIRFTGVLVLDNEAAVIARLEALAAVKADRTGGTITLKSVR
jgi:transmembrane sensor